VRDSHVCESTQVNGYCSVEKVFNETVFIFIVNKYEIIFLTNTYRNDICYQPKRECSKYYGTKCYGIA